MNCEEYEDLVAAHVDRQLDPAEMRRADQHVEVCRRCDATRAVQRETVALLRARRTVRPTPPSVREAIVRQTSAVVSIRRTTTRTRIMIAGAVAATLLLSILPVLRVNETDVIPILAADVARAETTAPELRTTSATTLRSYYAANGLAFEHSVDDLEPFGFDLVGGSVATLGHRPTTLTVYEAGAERVFCRRFRADDFPWPQGGRSVGPSEVFAHDGVYVSLTRLPGDVICAMTSRMPPDRLAAALHPDH